MSHEVHSQRSVDVFVVDTPRAAGVALGVPRGDAESTHVLCRHADETPRDFRERVVRRIQRIQLTRRVGSLWYVVGTDVATANGCLPLLGELLPMLRSDTTLTVVGPGSRQSVLFEGIDSVLQRRGHDLTVRAELYADGERMARGGMRTSRGHASSAPASTRSGAPANRHGGWFPLEVGSGSRAPDSVRAYYAG